MTANTCLLLWRSYKHKAIFNYFGFCSDVTTLQLHYYIWLLLYCPIWISAVHHRKRSVSALPCKSVQIYHSWVACSVKCKQFKYQCIRFVVPPPFQYSKNEIRSRVFSFSVMLLSFFFTAFIQSDTILEVLHFGEGGLLQVSAAAFPSSFAFLLKKICCASNHRHWHLHHHL